MSVSDITSTSTPELGERRENRDGGFVLLLLLCAAAATRLGWLAVLPPGAVALDILTWKWVALDLLNNVNPYASPPWLNHQPF
jgi:hypothetical protein